MMTAQYKYTCDAVVGRLGAYHDCNRSAVFEVKMPAEYGPGYYIPPMMLHYCRRHKDRVERDKAAGATVREIGKEA